MNFIWQTIGAACDLTSITGEFLILWCQRSLTNTACYQLFESLFLYSSERSSLSLSSSAVKVVVLGDTLRWLSGIGQTGRPSNSAILIPGNWHSRQGFILWYLPMKRMMSWICWHIDPLTYMRPLEQWPEFWIARILEHSDGESRISWSITQSLHGETRRQWKLWVLLWESQQLEYWKIPYLKLRSVLRLRIAVLFI